MLIGDSLIPRFRRLAIKPATSGSSAAALVTYLRDAVLSTAPRRFVTRSAHAASSQKSSGEKRTLVNDLRVQAKG